MKTKSVPVVGSKMETGKDFTRFFRYFTGAVVFLALVLRLAEAVKEFQYDELWTLINFTDLGAGEILCNVALPNNHPVNTLVLKFIRNFSEAPEILRMGGIICGLGVMWLTAEIAGRWLKKDKKSAFSAALYLGSIAPALILFSSTARGYIWQLLGLLLCTLGLMECAVRRDRPPYRSEFLIVAGGMLACLSVSSGVMFLLPLALGFLWFTPKSERFQVPVWAAAGILTLLTGCYYAVIFKAVQQGQVWGIDVDTPAAFSRFFFKTLNSHLPPFLALWVLAAVILYPAARKVFLLSLLPLAAALITRGGPERVYLPLTSVFIILAAIGCAGCMQRLPKFRNGIAVLFILCGAANYLLTPPEWQLTTPAADMRQVLKAAPEDCLPVLPATSGFPASVNDPGLGREIARRAIAPGKLIMLHTPDRMINGARPDKSEAVLELPVSGKPLPGDVPGFVYTLRPVDLPVPAGTPLVLPALPEVQKFLEEAKVDHLLLNLWFNTGLVYFSAPAAMPEFPGVRGLVIGEEK